MKTADVSCRHDETKIADTVFNRTESAITAPIRIDFAGTATNAGVSEMGLESDKFGTIPRRLFSDVFVNSPGEYS